MQGLDSWDDVRFFLALCRARTLWEAGAALGVDPSTLSRRLTQLERKLGLSLFQRGRSGLVPTEAAERLAPLAEQLERGMNGFASRAAHYEVEIEGEVRLSCPPDLAEVVLAPLLPDLLDGHPKLRLDVTPSESVVDLPRREADLALRTVRPRVGGLVVTRLARVQWVLAGLRCPG